GNGFDRTRLARFQYLVDIQLSQVNPMTELVRGSIFLMQFAACKQIPIRKRATRVVIGTRGACQSQRMPERLEDVFDIALYIVKTERTFLFVNALAAKGPRGGQNQRPSLSLSAINLAEFVKLHVANASVCIPLNSLQHPGDERRSEDGFVFRHWIEK